MIYRPAAAFYEDFEVISPIAQEALSGQCVRALGLTVPVSGTWTANLAIFVPFGVSRPFLVREVFWWNGSVGGNNVDVGIYDTAGNRLASLGSTAQGTGSQVVTSSAFTDYTIAPGDYYMAFSCDGTTNDVSFWSPAAVNIAAWGVGEAALGSVTLPDPATIVQVTHPLLPYFGLNGNTVDA